MSVAGTYNVTVKCPMGDQAGTFTVNVDGDSFTGSLTTAAPTAGSRASRPLTISRSQRNPARVPDRT